MALLEVRYLTKYFGGLTAIENLDFDISDSEIVGVIGPNGAGKSTLFNVITGFYAPSGGSIKFRGEDIAGLKPHKIAQKGIGRTFQATNLFIQSTVFENLLRASHMHYRQPEWKAFLQTSTVKQEEDYINQRATELLEFVGLGPRKDQLAGDLSSGYQKALAISIALATNPKLLLLDEPVTTLSSDKVNMIMELITKAREDRNTAVIIIEHNMKAIMDYCDRIVVLAYGKKMAEGNPEEIKKNDIVIEAYLGKRC